MGREAGTSIRCTLNAPAATVFGILSDTNRFDRISGVSPSTYTFELLDENDPTSRTRIGHATNGPIGLHFAEEGEYWCDRSLRGERQFRRGTFARLFRRGFFEVGCTPHGEDKTDVSLRVGFEPTWMGWIFIPLLLFINRRVLQRYVRSVEQLLAAPAERAPTSEPPAMQARHLIGQYHGDGTRVTGRRKGVSPAFTERVERLQAAPVDAVLRDKLIELARSAPDEALLQIQPLELAARWKVDGRELIRTFLHATRAGLFDLEWQVDCPTCRVGVDALPRLDQVRGRIHCDECDISFDMDFDAHVHATFTINPAVREVRRVVYCATSPYFRPHVQGYARIEPGETRELGPLPAGDILVRTRGAQRSLTVTRSDDGMIVEYGEDGFKRADGEVAKGVLRVTNRSARAIRLMVERAGWSSPRARGSLIMTIPGFVDLFGTDAPAAGLAIEVSRIAVLFTDLVGSVELYNRVGDAKAFALVQEHWRDIAMIVQQERRGSVIKTLGDGVFAAFVELDDAIAAALDIMGAAERLSKEHGLAFAIRAGCHEGPCFIVRANDRVDLFGSTVNLAARLSSVSGGQQLALVAGAAEPRLDALAAAGHDVERTTSIIKGMPGELSIALVTRKSTMSGPRLARMRTDPVGLPTLRKPAS